jgi:hypothetical protein
MMKALMLGKLAMAAGAALVLAVRAMARKAHTQRIGFSLEDRGMIRTMAVWNCHA